MWARELEIGHFRTEKKTLFQRMSFPDLGSRCPDENIAQILRIRGFLLPNDNSSADGTIV